MFDSDFFFQCFPLAVGSPILFDAPIGIDQHQHARGTDEALAPNP